MQYRLIGSRFEVSLDSRCECPRVLADLAKLRKALSTDVQNPRSTVTISQASPISV